MGGIRHVSTPGQPIRQRLLAHSGVDRSHSYEFCDPAPSPVHDYRATLRVTPITDGDRASVDWWATFDCVDDECEHWIKHFESDVLAVWLASLRANLGRAEP